MGGKHYPPPPPLPQKRAPGQQGTVWCPSTNSSLEISIFQIHQIFNISYFPPVSLTYPFRKKYFFPKMPENHPKIETKPAKRWLMKYAERFIVA